MSSKLALSVGLLTVTSLFAAAPPVPVKVSLVPHMALASTNTTYVIKATGKAPWDSKCKIMIAPKGDTSKAWAVSGQDLSATSFSFWAKADEGEYEAFCTTNVDGSKKPALTTADKPLGSFTTYAPDSDTGYLLTQIAALKAGAGQDKKIQELTQRVANMEDWKGGRNTKPLRDALIDATHGFASQDELNQVRELANGKADKADLAGKVDASVVAALSTSLAGKAEADGVAQAFVTMQQGVNSRFQSAAAAIDTHEKRGGFLGMGKKRKAYPGLGDALRGGDNAPAMLDHATVKAGLITK